ncbi:MAG: hypothetical protein IJV67_01920, partial [Clostridia bacterium]|nr:hypothetical protein [Clostridia bacterium]
PVEAAGEYELPECAFTAPVGKQFKGWSASLNGEVIDGETYLVEADTELFAVWEEIPSQGGGSETPENSENPESSETPENPDGEKDGLSTGAIVGIAVGGVVVVAVAGFAVFWFVVKKKSFADLIEAIKKKN